MIIYNKKEMIMEAEEKYNNSKKVYRVPLTIFDVIHKTKILDNTEDKEIKKPKETNEKDGNKNFLFPLSSIF